MNEAPAVKKFFKMKAYTGPVAVKELAAKLHAIPGFENVTAGTEHVYFTLTGASWWDVMYEAQQRMQAKYGTTFGLTPKEV